MRDGRPSGQYPGTNAQPGSVNISSLARCRNAVVQRGDFASILFWKSFTAIPIEELMDNNSRGGECSAVYERIFSFTGIELGTNVNESLTAPYMSSSLPATAGNMKPSSCHDFGLSGTFHASNGNISCTCLRSTDTKCVEKARKRPLEKALMG